MKDFSIRNVINVLNTVFISLMCLDISICYFRGEILLLYSSVILLIGLLISRLALKFDKQFLANLITLVSFYIVGFYHTINFGDYITCYFILMVAPLLSVFVFERISFKIIILFISCLLFLLCNYVAELSLLSNYFFYFGLVPSFITLLYFNERLAALTNEKTILIKDLENKNEEIVLYTNMMSHDLKAPLRSIQGFAGILKKRIDVSDVKNREMLEYIIQGGGSMSNLIDDLLLYSKSSLEEYEFEEVDLSKIIDTILYSFNYDLEKNNVTVDKIDLGKIIANKQTISLVFQNLISNALKYQPKIEEHSPKIIVKQISENGHVIISIEDNGIGMNEANLQKLFSPFVRFHSAQEYEGTGLGLSIVQKIIEKHNGEIYVTSEEGVGTEFKIKLPC